jgi:hypothetical protein
VVLVDQVDPKYQEGKPPTAMKKPHLPRIPLMGTNNQGHHQVLHQMALAQSSTSLDQQRSCHILHLTGIPPVHGHFRCCGSDDPAESHWMLAAEEGAISVLKMAANLFFSRVRRS